MALRLLCVVVAIQLVADHLVPNVSWQGHLAGLAIGLALGAVFVFGRRTADDPRSAVTEV
jgi:membrane associated rhomboid family serine protease